MTEPPHELRKMGQRMDVESTVSSLLRWFIHARVLLRHQNDRQEMEIQLIVLVKAWVWRGGSKIQTPPMANHSKLFFLCSSSLNPFIFILNSATVPVLCHYDLRFSHASRLPPRQKVVYICIPPSNQMLAFQVLRTKPLRLVLTRYFLFQSELIVGSVIMDHWTAAHEAFPTATFLERAAKS